MCTILIANFWQQTYLVIDLTFSAHRDMVWGLQIQTHGYFINETE